MNTKKFLSGRVNEVACQSVMWYNHFGGCTTLVCEKEEEGVLMSIMSFFVLILLLIVVIGVVNERVFHVQSDIALILFSLIICGGLYGVSCIPGMEELSGLLRRLGNFGFEEYLIDTVLCFMLFAGAGKVNMRKFRGNIKPICLLALISTILSSGFFGVLFWVGMKALGVPMDIWTCILLGSIVSPTDPIAATGILNKLGLSKNVTVVIESESLFNDGTGVALFLFVKSLVTHSGGSNFFMVMFQEVAGAFVVAFVVSFLMTKLMALSRDPVRHILISLLTVSMVYGICEHFHFSGVIASVVCGMFVAAQRGKMEGRIRVEDPHERYEDFWEVSEGILNAVLFVMIGLSLLALELSPFIWALIPMTILMVVLSRFGGVLCSGLFLGKKVPGNYNLPEFVMLMTWSALKGGLSLALAMSTKSILPPQLYSIVLNVAYITIFYTVIVQGLTMKKVYYRIEAHKANRAGRS